MKLAGPALTVEVRPGDNLMIHAAMAIAKPGDVIVVDGKGDLTAALMGEIMCQQCWQLGVAGVVIDGAVRDSLEIASSDCRCSAAGTNPNGPTKYVPRPHRPSDLDRRRDASIPATCWSAMPTA